MYDVSTEQSIYWAGSHIVKIFLLLHLPNRNLIFQCLFPFNTSFYKLFDNSISEKISFFLLIFTIALIFQFIKKLITNEMINLESQCHAWETYQAIQWGRTVENILSAVVSSSTVISI